MSTRLHRLNRAMLGLLMPADTAFIVADRLEELERDNASLAERLTAAELKRDELGARAEKAECEVHIWKSEAKRHHENFCAETLRYSEEYQRAERAEAELANLREAIEKLPYPAEMRQLRAENAALRAALTSIANQIGHIGPNEHPDEQKPRAETWLAERKNWQAEVERLRVWGGRAEIVLEKWRILCEMGLQDVCSEFVRPSVEQLWELTDELVPSEKTKARAALGEGRK